MAAMDLLRRLAFSEVCLFHDLQEGCPYAVLSVDRIILGPNRCCILQLETDEGIHKKVLV